MRPQIKKQAAQAYQTLRRHGIVAQWRLAPHPAPFPSIRLISETGLTLAHIGIDTKQSQLNASHWYPPTGGNKPLDPPLNQTGPEEAMAYCVIAIAAALPRASKTPLASPQQAAAIAALRTAVKCHNQMAEHGVTTAAPAAVA